MRLKGGLEKLGYHTYPSTHPWGVELSFKQSLILHDIINWLNKADVKCYYDNIFSEFWFSTEDDRTAFVLAWNK